MVLAALLHRQLVSSLTLLESVDDVEVLVGVPTCVLSAVDNCLLLLIGLNGLTVLADAVDVGALVATGLAISTTIATALSAFVLLDHLLLELENVTTFGS